MRLGWGLSIVVSESEKELPVAMALLASGLPSAGGELCSEVSIGEAVPECGLSTSVDLLETELQKLDAGVPNGVLEMLERQLPSAVALLLAGLQGQTAGCNRGCLA